MGILVDHVQRANRVMSCGMRRRSLGAVVWLMGIGLTHPCAVRAQGTSAGIVGGVTVAEINTSGNEALNVALTDKIEPIGGVFLVWAVVERLWIQPEVLLSVKGSRLVVADRRERIRLRYVEVPVLLRYAAPLAGAAQVHLFAGPYAAYLVSASAEARAGRSVSLDRVFEPLDLGWLAGLGIGARSLRLELRYGGGIRNIAKRPDLGGIVPASPAGSIKYRNRGFALMAAYAF